MSDALPRYSTLAFPPYSYVPGYFPHPVSDPAGHMFGESEDQVAPLANESWRQSEAYCYGVDLFNHGYYWEAHEAWESLWHAAGRTGTTADFLKGLIKLAAAGVKAREGNNVGVRRHAQRAQQLFSSLTGSYFYGLALNHLLAQSEQLVRRSPQYSAPNPQLRLEIEMVLQAN